MNCAPGPAPPLRTTSLAPPPPPPPPPRAGLLRSPPHFKDPGHAPADFFHTLPALATHLRTTGHKIGWGRTTILTTTRYKSQLDLASNIEHAAIKTGALKFHGTVICDRYSNNIVTLNHHVYLWQHLCNAIFHRIWCHNLDYFCLCTIPTVLEDLLLEIEIMRSSVNYGSHFGSIKTHLVSLIWKMHLFSYQNSSIFIYFHNKRNWYT